MDCVAVVAIAEVILMYVIFICHCGGCIVQLLPSEIQEMSLCETSSHTYELNDNVELCSGMYSDSL